MKKVFGAGAQLDDGPPSRPSSSRSRRGLRRLLNLSSQVARFRQSVKRPEGGRPHPRPSLNVPAHTTPPSRGRRGLDAALFVAGRTPRRTSRYKQKEETWGRGSNVTGKLTRSGGGQVKAVS